MRKLANPHKLALTIAFLVYTVLLIWFGNVIRLVVVTPGWPKVAARVINCEVVTRQQPAGGRYGRQPFTRHKLNITYTYMVAGRTYTSSQYGIARALDATSAFQLDQLRARYMPGSDTIAFYDPKSPGRAYLATGWYSVSCAVWITGNSLIFLGLAALLGGMGKMREWKWSRNLKFGTRKR